MKRVILATAGVAVDRGGHCDARVGPVHRPDRAGAAGGEGTGAAEAARRHRESQAADRRGQVRHAAVRLPRRPGKERRRRRRDRQVVRALRVRPRAASHVRVRPDRGARAAADERSRRPRDLDVHVHGRPGHADRLLAAVLQRDRAVARQERLADPEPRRPRRQEGRDDERLDLRPLDEAVLHGHRGRRRGQRHERRPRLQPGARRRGHVRRHVARPDRGHKPARRS